METQSLGNIFSTKAASGNNNLNKSIFSFFLNNSVNTSNGHDTSGHCQKMIHVPSHMRAGKRIDAYDRICGQDHDAKEAQQKNMEEAGQQISSSKKSTSTHMQQKYGDLIQAYWPYLKEHEGPLNYAYLDTLGKITAGAGLYIPDEASFISLPWIYQGREATIAQKQAEYKRLKSFRNRGAFGTNQTSEDFRVKDLSKEFTLSEHIIIDKALEHLENDLQALESKFIDFDSYPRALQMVLLDMQYNMGGNFNAEKWPRFFEGIRQKNISQMIEQVNRYQVGKNRNDWSRDTLRNIPLINGWHY